MIIESLFTSLNNNNNNEVDDLKEMTSSNSFRPQIILQQKQREQTNSKGNSQINIRLNINSEIINNNFQKTNNKNTKLKNHSIFKDDLIKVKDKTINELEKEIFNTRKLINNITRDKNKSTKINSDTKGIINMANYNTLLKKQQTQLSLSEKLFFHNLMKNTKMLNQKLIRQTRFMSPKCFSSSSVYLGNESRANSPFDSHSVKNEKNYSLNHAFNNKDKKIKSKTTNIKLSTTIASGIGTKNNISNITNNLFLIKERLTKVFRKYDVMAFDNILNSKSQIGLPSKILVQNYMKHH